MSGTLDRFFGHYYGRRPVNATFTGVHTHDEQLPDWSPTALERLDDEMHSLARELSAEHPAPSSLSAFRDDPELLDAELARAFLEVQLVENASKHGVSGNPSLWAGEAIFSVVSLMIRDFAPLNERIASATARLNAIPAFLDEAPKVVGDSPLPAPWVQKAIRECDGGTALLERGIETWLASGDHSTTRADRLRVAVDNAKRGFAHFCGWLRSHAPSPHSSMACGPAMFDVLLSRGHHAVRSRSELLFEARSRFVEAKRRLDSLAKEVAGSWPAAQAQLAADHPSPSNYLATFAEVWGECHDRATSQDIVTWPEWPIRYSLIPEATREAAPFLYYLYYRSPAPFDPYDVYDYRVPPVPDDPAAAEKHLRDWNAATIKLNHVVHHGAIGHHVQNWHAYHRSRSRIGKIAAVDCANRIGMFCGGSMAEGWACYATTLMDEMGFLTPLERVSEAHSQVRFLGRAIVDVELHQGTMSFDEAVSFYVGQVGMAREVAHAEAVKNSMFPCTGIMYWLGLQRIQDLRAQMETKRGSAFSLKSFHDELLSYGSIPVPLVGRLMLGE